MLTKKTIPLAGALALASLTAFPAAADIKLVTITYIVDHPAIESVRQGIVDALAEEGFVEGENVRYVTQSAQGAMPTQWQIAREFAGLEPDLMVAISTPSAQALQSTANGEIPVLFAAVTDPIGAKLVESWETPGANITGTSDGQDFGPTLDLIKALVPDLERLGVIYNAGEANSVAQVEKLEANAEEHGITIVKTTAAQSAMVPDAARSLVGRVDAILIPTDSTVVSGVEGVVMVGERASIPIFASDTDSVERGALAALGFDYYRLGKISGVMGARILNGESPADIPVTSLDTQNLYINKRAAAAMGVSLSEEILASATKVVD
jgi:putative tryptophan/tyrosine transport system substrate-binding protein